MALGWVSLFTKLLENACDIALLVITTALQTNKQKAQCMVSYGKLRVIEYKYNNS